MLRRAFNSLPLAAGPAGAAPEWVQLLPAGQFSGRDGAGPYSLDDPAAVIAATLAAAAGADLPIDYDHQILWSKDNGQPAPAAAWMKEFQVRADGIFARVDWTPAAAARVAAREYRYLSPVFWHDDTGRIIRVEHAALTNTPNLEMQALASRLHSNGGEMDPKQLAALLVALGLPANTTVEQLVAHAKSLADIAKESGQTLAAMAKRLGLPEDSKVLIIDQALASCLEAVDQTAQALGLSGPTKPTQLAICAKELLAAKLGQAQTAGPDPSQYVPMSEFRAVASRLKALETSLTTDKATAAVQAAMAAGKVTPKNKEWAIAYASKDLEGFKSFVEGAPVIVAPGQHGPGGTPPTVAGQLGEADLAVCSQLGISADDYKRNLDKEVG